MSRPWFAALAWLACACAEDSPPAWSAVTALPRARPLDEVLAG